MNAKNGFRSEHFHTGEVEKFLPDSFRLTRTPAADEWWLLPRQFDGKLEDLCRIQLVHCDENEASLESVVLEPNSAPQTLDLRVHDSFLGITGARSGVPDEGFLFCDVAAAELAQSLVDAERSVWIDGLARFYLFGMLCARLKDLLDRIRSSACRRFETWQLAEISEVFSDRAGEEVSVASTAARCRLSVCQFSRIFKATYGMPLHKFLMNERVKRAQQLLAETEEPIAQIALDCGFADQSSFTRRFSMVAGIPPGLFRKQSQRNSRVPSADSRPTTASMVIAEAW